MIEFFIQMKLPTVTHQQKKVHVVNGKPHYYEPDALKDARQKFSAHLAAYVPEKKLTGPIRLLTKWCAIQLQGTIEMASIKLQSRTLII